MSALTIASDYYSEEIHNTLLSLGAVLGRGFACLRGLGSPPSLVGCSQGEAVSRRLLAVSTDLLIEALETETEVDVDCL